MRITRYSASAGSSWISASAVPSTAPWTSSSGSPLSGPVTTYSIWPPLTRARAVTGSSCASAAEQAARPIAASASTPMCLIADSERVSGVVRMATSDLGEKR
jgi:hypothetical protein